MDVCAERSPGTEEFAGVVARKSPPARASLPARKTGPI